MVTLVHFWSTLVHFRFSLVQFLGPWQVNLSPFQNHKSKLKHFWSISNLTNFWWLFLGSSAILFGTWMEWLTSDASQRLLQFEGEDFIIWMIIGHLKNALVVWRIYDANAVLLETFFAGKFKGKEKTGHQGRKGRKGNDQGKRVGLFLGYCDQMDLLR